MDKFELIYKKYKDIPIKHEEFDFIINKALENTKKYILNSNVSEKIIFMNEVDKQICISLKNKIKNNDIESEIYLIEKYKYIFSLPKINKLNFSNAKKEEIIVDALNKYNEQMLFSKYLINYIKKLYLNKSQKNNEKINLVKLKKILLSQKEIMETKENIDVLYKYFIDIEDIMNNKNLTGKEKLIITLKFGYIKSHFCSEKLISKILNIDVDEVEKVYNENQKKLQKIFDYDLEEHYLNK